MTVGTEECLLEQQVYREQQVGERLRGGSGRRAKVGREQTASQVGGEAPVVWCGCNTESVEVMWELGLRKGAKSGCQGL